MISVEEALKTIEERTRKTESIELPLLDAQGYILSKEISSPINMPPFPQSAMDGYAVKAHSTSTYTLIGETQAGDDSALSLKEGEAIRIFTGAMVPNGTDAVVKQEDVDSGTSEIEISKTIRLGENIRPMGEQIMAGDLALEKGTYLNTGAIGFLTALGITHVSVYDKPKIGVIATGNELTKPGEPLSGGKIYESNTYTLAAALGKSGFDTTISTVIDDYQLTKKKIKAALDTKEVVIITGGISVGDYDFVGDVLEELGVVSDFYKVKQKPGKPIFFGHIGPKLVFALPGNPAAVLSCFYIYVLPCLQRMIGKKHNQRVEEFALRTPYSKTAKMTHFLKAYAANGEVEILTAQSSAMLRAFVDANCLIQMDQGMEEWKIGDKVKAIMLPS
ncbi:MAG: molybdopterin molybdotransferase MoeA [Crocinitomicaceae bacterium]|nr:molybdopterin molybdotransferase MoeA [Crocinitomicaceae bacterium]MDG1657119.1 molybdopterin molybdotransferase MoeA [Crocinitomicaceae bacterium]